MAEQKFVVTVCRSEKQVGGIVVEATSEEQAKSIVRRRLRAYGAAAVGEWSPSPTGHRMKITAVQSTHQDS